MQVLLQAKLLHDKLLSASQRSSPTCGTPAPSRAAGLPMHGWGFERCVALLLQLLLPLPLVARSAALAQLQSKLASQLLSYLGTSLERVLESERSCQVGGASSLCTMDMFAECLHAKLPCTLSAHATSAFATNATGCLLHSP